MSYIGVEEKPWLKKYQGISRHDEGNDKRVLLVDHDGWSRDGGKEVIWMLVAYDNGKEEVGVGISLGWKELKRLSDDLKVLTDEMVKCGFDKDEKHNS